MSATFRRTLLATLVLCVVAGGAFTYRMLQGQDASAVSRTKPRAAAVRPVIAGTVVEKAMPVVITAIGTVQPMNSVAVHTRVDSQIVKVFVRDGQHVRAGEKLFALDQRQLTAQRSAAVAVLKRDRLQYGLARRTFRRKSPKLDSALAIDQARTNMEALAASIAADNATLQNLDVQLSYTTIKSPISGRLGTVAYKVGSNVKVSDPTPLVTINQLSPVYVAFSVPQSYLGHIQEAMARGAVPVQASLPSTHEPPESGHVAYLENAVDSSTSTISVKGEFPNKHERLWPGAYVNVHMTLRTEPHALVVPAQTVQVGQHGAYVFVIKADDTVEMRPVTVDRTVGEETVIASGLHRGERVVVDGQLRLVNGVKVEAHKAQPKAGQ